MEIRKPKIKSIPYEEFKDNETLEKLAQELNEGGTNVIVGSLDQAINWGRSNSLWSLTFGTSCCGIEFMAVGCARYDFARFGFEVTRNSPRQGRPHHVCRHHHQQDGPGLQAPLRRDSRTEICRGRGWLRHLGRTVQEELQRSEGHRRARARGCLYPRLPPRAPRPSSTA